MDKTFLPRFDDFPNAKDYTFDWEKFVSLPKCKGEWTNNGSGCLLTAMWYALGIGIDQLESQRASMISITDHWAKTVWPERSYPLYKTEFTMSRNCNGVVQSIIHSYDHGHEAEALDLIFELITALWGPEPTGSRERITEQICTKESCAV